MLTNEVKKQLDYFLQGSFISFIVSVITCLTLRQYCKNHVLICRNQ